MIDWGAFEGKTTFILGSDKHAGKTTFLKYALESLRSRGNSVAYMSVGYDGEPYDFITGQHKPRLDVVPGDIVVTSESLIEKSGVDFERIEVFPFATVLGRPVLARARSHGAVELSGPASNSKAGAILQRVNDEGPGAVLVDGAVDRVTQAVAGDERCGSVLVVRCRAAELDSAASRIRMAAMLDSVPVRSDPGEYTVIAGVVDGALTESRLEGLQGSGPVMVEDFTKVFLPEDKLRKLVKGRGLVFARGLELTCIVANLFDVEASDLESRLGAAAHDRLVLLNLQKEKRGQTPFNGIASL